MNYISKNNLNINSTLYEFVNKEILPGIDIKPEDFWEKFDKVIHVDNADRGANSLSDSNFEIEFDHALLLDDTNGVSIKSLTVANPLQTVNANVNDKLYLRLGVLDRVVSLAANDYDTNTLPTQIGTAINALFTALPSINFTATSEWYRFANQSVGVPTAVQ